MVNIPRLAGSTAELVAGASERTVVRPGDARSGSTFERVVIDGQPYFLKTLGRSTDWMMRVMNDRDLRTFRVWEAGIMDRSPPSIDHAVVGMAREGDDPDALLSILMHDVGRLLVAEGDDPIATRQHLRFLEHMAELSVSWWGWRDSLGLTAVEDRLRFFAPDNIAPEAVVDDPPGAVAAAVEGWSRLPTRSPALWELADRVHRAPDELADAMADTPQTFLQGDWKMGNLGAHPDGRTVLLDWAYPGGGPACWDLCWYLALNRARLPDSKEISIESFRLALEAHGITTRGWFAEQLDLCLLGVMATFGWEKALGDEAELRWWEARALEGAARLGW